MEPISVVMSVRSLLISSLLVAVLPGVVLVMSEWLSSKTLSPQMLLLSAAIYGVLQAFVVFQGVSGRVSLDRGVLQVRSGFYSASWPSAGLRVVEERQSPVPGLRINGVAMFGIRAGWFLVDGRDAFVLTTTDERLCLARNAKVVVCLDRHVVERLWPFLDG
ncbi:hypothetical protein [Metapseudomonas resinovorans]|uniref:Bacterial Pleckstrin homology domain-containing protein n=1 Tax=Metapseudomonas resinovorans NBRC 106553 TaxID=1245471 RepID=S6APD9_METRE|nr:hypothetical protein [Pseudomonas resinovorans]BAN47508.1 hypothetical protein PCA10_17760 [Pseudomonas resinovorans NBRC 106553]